MSSSSIWTHPSSGWAHSIAMWRITPNLEEAILPQTDDILKVITTVSEY